MAWCLARGDGAGGGRAIILSGASGAGKTTLAGALIALGGRLISDDATPIEAGTRLVWPCPLAMGVKQGSWPLFARSFAGFDRTEPIAHGGRVIRYHPMPGIGWGRGHKVAALVFPTWEAGAGFETERLGPADTLSLLAASGMMPPETEADIADLLGWLGAVPAWRLRHDDTEMATDFVRGLARTPIPATP